MKCKDGVLFSPQTIQDYFGKTKITSRFNSEPVELHNVMHVPGMKKNLLSVSQLTKCGNYMVFGPNNVKVYRHLEPGDTPILEEHKFEPVYVMFGTNNIY